MLITATKTTLIIRQVAPANRDAVVAEGAVWDPKAGAYTAPLSKKKAFDALKARLNTLDATVATTFAPPPKPAQTLASVPQPASTSTAFKPESGVTPLRQQYLKIKAEYPNAILFFRLGDFYEAFDEDAKIAAKVLDLVLTGRPVSKNERVPMAGFPHHALDQYLAKMLEAGYHVAVCEQMNDMPENGMIKREVTRVLQPAPTKLPPVEVPVTQPLVLTDVTGRVVKAGMTLQLIPSTALMVVETVGDRSDTGVWLVRGHVTGYGRSTVQARPDAIQIVETKAGIFAKPVYTPLDDKDYAPDTEWGSKPVTYRHYPTLETAIVQKPDPRYYEWEDRLTDWVTITNVADAGDMAIEPTTGDEHLTITPAPPVFEVGEQVQSRLTNNDTPADSTVYTVTAQDGMHVTLEAADGQPTKASAFVLEPVDQQKPGQIIRHMIQLPATKRPLLMLYRFDAPGKYSYRMARWDDNQWLQLVKKEKVANIQAGKHPDGIIPPIPAPPYKDRDVIWFYETIDGRELLTEYRREPSHRDHAVGAWSYRDGDSDAWLTVGNEDMRALLDQGLPPRKDVTITPTDESKLIDQVPAEGEIAANDAPVSEEPILIDQPEPRSYWSMWSDDSDGWVVKNHRGEVVRGQIDTPLAAGELAKILNENAHSLTDLEHAREVGGLWHLGHVNPAGKVLDESCLEIIGDVSDRALVNRMRGLYDGNNQPEREAEYERDDMVLWVDPQTKETEFVYVEYTAAYGNLGVRAGANKRMVKRSDLAQHHPFRRVPLFQLQRTIFSGLYDDCIILFDVSDFYIVVEKDVARLRALVPDEWKSLSGSVAHESKQIAFGSIRKDRLPDIEVAAKARRVKVALATKITGLLDVPDGIAGRDIRRVIEAGDKTTTFVLPPKAPVDLSFEPLVTEPLPAGVKRVDGMLLRWFTTPAICCECQCQYDNFTLSKEWVYRTHMCPVCRTIEDGLDEQRDGTRAVSPTGTPVPLVAPLTEPDPSTPPAAFADEMTAALAELDDVFSDMGDGVVSDDVAAADAEDETVEADFTTVIDVKVQEPHGRVGIRSVKAKVYGTQLALHRMADTAPTKYALTHIPTGCAVVQKVKSLNDAKRFAEAIQSLDISAWMDAGSPADHPTFRGVSGNARSMLGIEIKLLTEKKSRE